MLIAGIDEAGRGPCFGPMTMAIAVIEKNKQKSLKSDGVKDSKDILPNKRNFLFNSIKKDLIEYYVDTVDPLQINDEMVKNNLNEIEAMHVADLINKVKTKVDCFYVDSPDATKGKFELRIRKYLKKEKEKVKIVSENKADSKYVVVGAASILAKVTRDNEIEKIKKDYGDFGSGYPSDPKTKAYLKQYVDNNKTLPPFSRIFWKTCTKALEDIQQEKLF